MARPLANGKSDKKALYPFGRAFKELRDHKHLSQVAVAKAAQVSTGYVGLIETGERGSKPSLDVVKRLAAALEANLAETETLMRAAGWLGKDEELLSEDKPTTRQMIAADALLSEDDKRLILSMYDRCTRNASRV